MSSPVSARRVAIAEDFGLVNVAAAAEACRLAGLPFWAACALLEMESPDFDLGVKGGANVWGNDKETYSNGEVKQWGTFSGYPLYVDEDSYLLFRHEVIVHKKLSNGVGPCQITWPGFFTDMETRGLRPWVPVDNMRYGFELMWWLYQTEGSWFEAGHKYNGKLSYAAEFADRVAEWHDRLNIKAPIDP